MGCICRARLNSLISIWYSIITVLTQIYLLYLGLERYKLYTEMKWPHGAYPNVWLTLYISLYATCIPLCFLLFAFGIFKSGNIAGDNERLGARIERILEFTRRTHEKRLCSPLICMRNLWQHAPPIPQTIHITLAICQLFAQQVMLAQLYRFGFINSGDFLNTEMDFLYQRARQLATNLPVGDTRLQSFRMTSDELANSPVAPNLLPILMHARLFGIPLEFFNLWLALLAYSCVYSSVFWAMSKPFSLLFSFHLLLHSADIIWTYLGFSVLFRIQETNYYSIRPLGIGQHLSPVRPLMIYHPLAIIMAFLATIFLMHLTPVALYAYGHSKFYLSMLAVRLENARSQSIMEGHNKNLTRIQSEKTGCSVYGPILLGIIFLSFTFIAKVPACYAIWTLNAHEMHPFFWTCIILDGVYLMSTMIIWLILTLKRDCSFKVMLQVHEIISLQNAKWTGAIHKNPSELKNALILMHGDQLYVTDDATLKQTFMRQAFKGSVQEDVYLLKSNSTPMNRKVPLEEGKASPEMTRLLGASMRQTNNMEHSVSIPVAYHQINRSEYGVINTQSQQSILMNNTNTPILDGPMSSNVNTFGTLQRGVNRMGYGPNSQMIRPPILNQADSYASIHKPIRNEATHHIVEAPLQRRESKSDVMGPNYGSGGMYATYGRSRPSNGQYQYSQNTLTRSNNPIYGSIRQSSEPAGSRIQETPMSSVKTSPILVEKRLNSVTVGMRDSPPKSSLRESPPKTMKFTSFNDDSEKFYGSVQRPLNSILRPTLDTQQLVSPNWNGNYKPTISASSSQQEQAQTCLTPTSTISNYSTQQHTPATGSPSSNNPPDMNRGWQRDGGGHNGFYGDSERIIQDATLTRNMEKKSISASAKPPSGVISVSSRVPIKSTTVSVATGGQRNDDSANYSLSSSNTSTEQVTVVDQARQKVLMRPVRRPTNEFATSVV